MYITEQEQVVPEGPREFRLLETIARGLLTEAVRSIKPAAEGKQFIVMYSIEAYLCELIITPNGSLFVRCLRKLSDDEFDLIQRGDYATAR